MAVVNKRLAKGKLGNTEGTLYTVPSATKTYIKALTLCNVAITAKTITLKFAGTEVLYNYSLGACDTITIPFFDHILEAEETITGLSDASNSIAYYISGREVS